VHAYAGLGEAYWGGEWADRGKQWLDLASTNCKKALGADPRLAEAHTCLGNLYNDTGNYEKAVDEFNRALGLDKSIVQTYNGLGKAYTRLGKTTEAQDTYKQAISMWPQYWAVYNWLGQFYVAQARYSDAVPMFQKVNQLRPDNYRGYSNLGGTLLLEGKYDEAIEALNCPLRCGRTCSHTVISDSLFLPAPPSDAVAFTKGSAPYEHLYMNWGNLGDLLYWVASRRLDATAAYKQAITLARLRYRSFHETPPLAPIWRITVPCWTINLHRPRKFERRLSLPPLMLMSCSGQL
jgi:tetratricopeptide (TPR) repeat protein